MVLFVTGRCNRTCWYCPLGSERKDRDAIFANEKRVSSIEEIVQEAEVMSALGTGVTGGEPLLVLDRVVEFCSNLKERFGKEHHIHLYTGSAPQEADLRRLAGLVDEIRLHPPQELWPRILDTPYARSLRWAREMGFDVGIEVPALPGLEDLAPALPLLDFLNINELEWGEVSGDAMRSRGLVPVDSLHNAVKNSHRWAAPLRRHAKVHWCSSSFKDSVQLRERLKRIARNTARPFDEVTEDGTIVYGVIEIDSIDPMDLPLLTRIPWERNGGHIEMGWKALRRNSQKLPGNKYIVERYPNGGIIVEV
ncbi:MAG TPA: radical SAM protein, partial [Methanomicrobiales archaeon]|nr:radical SAM protein [Methanomicrobiales archaeon]